MRQDIVEQFEFIDYQELQEWSETLKRDFKFDEEITSALYTDGDSGIALVRLSDYDVDLNIEIELIDCTYIDLKLLDLVYIQSELLEQLERDIENDV